MKSTRHNKYIQQLFKKNLSDDEVRNEVREKFGIYFTIDQIKGKRLSELDEILKSFDQNSKELVYPILYKGFPNKTNLPEKINLITDYLIELEDTHKSIPKKDILLELRDKYQNGINDQRHDAFTYKLIYQYKKITGQKLVDSDNISSLKQLLDNPLENFLKLSTVSFENFSFKEDSKEFDSIIKEICRDNIITEIEKKFLEEKAKEFLIDQDKLRNFLENPFIGYESFNILVEQICEDGIVTDTEKEYINEKAIQYNVSEEMLNEMINIGLVRSTFRNNIISSEKHYDVILFYLVAYSFGFKSLIDRHIRIYRSEKFDSDKYSSTLLKKLLISVSNKLSKHPYFLTNWENTTQLFDRLNISYLTFKQAKSRYDTTNKNNKLSDNKKLSLNHIQDKIYIDSLKIDDVEIIKINNLVRPFDVKFLGSKICIEYSNEIDEIILVKALSVFYLKNSKTISKINFIKQINRILGQLLNE